MQKMPRSEGAKVVFECAGLLSATPEGLGYYRHSGTFVEVGHFVDMDFIDFNINRLLMRKYLSLETIWALQTSHFVQTLPILERGTFHSTTRSAMSSPWTWWPRTLPP